MWVWESEVGWVTGKFTTKDEWLARTVCKNLNRLGRTAYIQENSDNNQNSHLKLVWDRDKEK